MKQLSLLKKNVKAFFFGNFLQFFCNSFAIFFWLLFFSFQWLFQIFCLPLCLSVPVSVSLSGCLCVCVCICLCVCNMTFIHTNMCSEYKLKDEIMNEIMRSVEIHIMAHAILFQESFTKIDHADCQKLCSS